MGCSSIALERELQDLQFYASSAMVYSPVTEIVIITVLPRIVKQNTLGDTNTPISR